MKTVKDQLEEEISAAMQAYAPGAGICPAIVQPSTNPQFGDYQVNGVMPLAKTIKANPVQSAQEIVLRMDVSKICEQPEVAGPGFINLRLKNDFVAKSLLEVNKDPANLGIEKAAEPKTVVVDFSSPNIAKQMHVGHLRSTIIGDCICRILEFLGHKVIRQNHIGDWGLQFGMLFASMKEQGHRVPLDVVDLEQLYKDAKKRFDTDQKFATTATTSVVDLHVGDARVRNDWKEILEKSLTHCFQIYDLLGGIFKKEDICGESFYKDMLKDVVSELKKKGLAVESEGAICVFLPGFKDKEGNPLPVIIQKSDGAYLYATTDLAAIRYRVEKLNADRIIYVTDARQNLHFQMLFAVAEMAGWLERNGKKIEPVHVTFGSVLGENGKPLKTREGENVKLKELLDEAVTRARKIVEEKNPELPDKQKDEIARAVGIGAVKYADYSNNRTSDYVFSFDKMLAMEGNTAPYMQYAYARIKSIERKAETKGVKIEDELADIKTLSLTEPAELNLGKHLIRYGEAVEAAASDYRPNYLTSYLYDLAQKFSVFYTDCPVLDAGPDKRPTRLLLCDLTARTIEHGLSTLLGIEVVEQM